MVSALQVGFPTNQGKDTKALLRPDLLKIHRTRPNNQYQDTKYARDKDICIANSRLAALAAVAVPADDLPDGEAVDIVVGLLLGEGAGHGGTAPDPSLGRTTAAVEAGVRIVSPARCRGGRLVSVIVLGHGGRPALTEDGRGQHGAIVVTDPTSEGQAAARTDDGALALVVVAVRPGLLHLAAGADGRAEVMARRRVDAAGAGQVRSAPLRVEEGAAGAGGRGGAVVARARAGVHGGDAVDEGAAEGGALAARPDGPAGMAVAGARRQGRSEAG